MQRISENIFYFGPITSDKPKHKYRVFIVKYTKNGDKHKWVYFGDPNYEDYTQHHDPKRRKSFRTRAEKIRNKFGFLTKNDPFSANYWNLKYSW